MVFHGRITIIPAAFFCVLALALTAHAQGPYMLDDVTPSTAPANKLAFLPPGISDGLEVNLWGWLGYQQEKSDEWESYWDAEFQLDINKSFGDRLAITADVNFIDSNNYMFGQLEQMFGTMLISDQSGTLLTIGKFNASFGAEQRDFWNRMTGTTSLLFGAQPQDLIGIMVTQPIGQTGIKIRPFVVNDFEGHFNFDRPPSAGLTVEYHPDSTLGFSVTNWVGPGFVREDDDDDSEGTAEADEYRDVVAQNYLGPDFQARTGGTLYFLDAKAQWLPRPDVTLLAEGLFGTTGSSDGRAIWGGALLLANYDITDRWRVFGRWSFLNDAAGVVTGTAQCRHELSAGVGYQILHNVELRTEYRHDFSSAEDDSDSISVHLSFGI